MRSQGSVTRLITQIASGGPGEREAAAAIWNRYRERLLALACQHLPPRFRQREDMEDVLQNMYKSFFRRVQQGQFQLDDRDQLVNLLMGMTVNKVRKVLARHTRKKRDIRIEKKNPELDEGMLDQLRSLEPGPEDAAEFTEGLERGLDALGDLGLRQIAVWKLEGYTNQEIAEMLGCVERTVERKLKLIRRKWEESYEE